MNSLDKDQLKAVNAPDTHIFVNGLPGAGKTRVIVERINTLLSRGILPCDILAITFTNKAAKVMRDRLNNPLVTCTTMHSLGVKILSEKFGRFPIYDDHDSTSIIKKILRFEGLNPSQAWDYYEYIESQKENLRRSDEDESDKGQVYRAYQVELAKVGAFDFADLIASSCIYLTKYNPETFKWKHVLVDEVQDTSTSQFEFIEILARRGSKIFAVGDLDQSIYQFRGAKPGNITQFIKTYNPLVINLTINYRCSKIVIEKSGKLISHNKERIPKPLVPKDGAEEGTLKIQECEDEFKEADFITEKIRELSGKTAILYRTNWLSAIIESALKARNITYNLKDDVSFMNRREIKDLSAFLRIILFPQDLEALKRVLSCGPGRFGKKTLEEMEDAKPYFKREEQRLFFGRLLEFIETLKIEKDSEVIVTKILKWSDNLWYKEPGRIKSIEVAKEIGRGKELSQFVEELSLRDIPVDVIHKITLMTLHASKGTEFDNIIICGCDDITLPHYNAESIEEERRLFYVGITRAQKNVLITWPKYRRLRSQVCSKSRFIRELDT